MAARSLLVQSVSLAYSRVEVYGRWRVPGPRPGVPGTRKQFPAHSVQLPNVSPSEVAKEGPQSGRCLRPPVPMLPASSACLPRSPDLRPPPKVKAAVHKLAQTRIKAKSDRQRQSLHWSPGGARRRLRGCARDALMLLSIGRSLDIGLVFVPKPSSHSLWITSHVFIPLTRSLLSVDSG